MRGEKNTEGGVGGLLSCTTRPYLTGPPKIGRGTGVRFETGSRKVRKSMWASDSPTPFPQGRVYMRNRLNLNLILTPCVMGQNENKGLVLVLLSCGGSPQSLLRRVGYFYRPGLSMDYKFP